MAKILLVNGSLAQIEEPHVIRLRALANGREILVHPSPDMIAERIADVEILFGALDPGWLEKAVSLRWIQMHGAGIDRLPTRIADSPITVTNASGVHAVQITEHILALLLALGRNVHAAVRAQSRRRWLRHSDQKLFELAGRRALLVGTGAIGRHFARAVGALGVEVVGVRRHPERGGTGMIRAVGPDQLREELPGADFLVLVMPLTAETRGMIGEDELRLMKPSAHLINVGRGRTVRQDALVRALEERWIAGAGLDVVAEEPLPPDSPLWTMDNVIITSHYAGLSPNYSDRLWEIFLDNMERYGHGRPLRNIVDLELGY